MATEVVIPMLGITVENGRILEWLKNEGDPVKKGESLFVVEADKVTTEVESPATGILAKILLPAGQKVSVLTVVAVITDPGEKLPAKYEDVAAPDETAGIELGAGRQPDRTEQKVPVSVSPDAPLRIIPAARKLALEKGIPLASLAGTGPGGVILLRDVEAAAAKAPRASTLARKYAAAKDLTLEGIAGSGVRGRIMRDDVRQAAEASKMPALGATIPLDTMRRVIARRMSESARNAPHIYFFTDVRMESLFNFRQEILPDFEQRFGIRLSINDLLIKAVALNIADFPILNATIREDEIYIPPDINVCLAVALPQGLIVPAIASADRLDLAQIARQRADLVHRARLGKLTLAELERGTFTISSLAQYEITHFTAILNPPQSGILSVGKVRDELFLDGQRVKTRKVVTLGLAVDHRVIDGVAAADFLQSLKQKLEKPIATFFNW